MISKCAVLVLLLTNTFAADTSKTVPNDGLLPNGGKIWVLLTAGTNMWFNYGCQADIYHAHQIVTLRGIPEDNIVVMAYDDLSDNPQNPAPGTVINEPYGSDVYQGVKIDYRQKDVSPEIFLAVLQGNSTTVQGKGTGRVIKSGPNDNIFIAFVGSAGVPGRLNFPGGKNLKASSLIAALNSMAADEKFGKMLLYVDASYSGSMFENLLPNDTNIIAITSSNSQQESWFCYHSYRYNTFLGTTFTINWMHDDEARDLTDVSIQQQFDFVRNVTPGSVSMYGDLKLTSLNLSQFLGPKDVPTITFKPCVGPIEMWSSPLFILSQKLRNASRISDAQLWALETEMLEAKRRRADSIFNNIINLVTNGEEGPNKQYFKQNYQLNEQNLLCYEKCVDFLEEKCSEFSKSPYFGKSLYVFANICSSGKTNLENIRTAIETVCKETTGEPLD